MKGFETALYVLVLVGLLVMARRLGAFLSIAGFTVVTWAWLNFGFSPGIPASAMQIYLALLIAGVLIYATHSEETWEGFWGPIRKTMVEPSRMPLLALALLLIPAVVAWKAYAASLPTATPPPKIRSVHPAPPNTMTVQTPDMLEGHVFNIIEDRNPLRELEETNPQEFAKHVARGKVVYYENCFFCHGDTLAADGHFAAAVKPPPASFQDKGTIAMLTESFLYWRIAKGGPGLPTEGTPFDSTMPVWEKFLSEEDMWNAILFMYDYTGYRPRGQDTGHEGGH